MKLNYMFNKKIYTWAITFCLYVSLHSMEYVDHLGYTVQEVDSDTDDIADIIAENIPVVLLQHLDKMDIIVDYDTNRHIQIPLHAIDNNCAITYMHEGQPIAQLQKINDAILFKKLGIDSYTFALNQYGGVKSLHAASDGDFIFDQDGDIDTIDTPSENKVPMRDCHITCHDAVFTNKAHMYVDRMTLDVDSYDHSGATQVNTFNFKGNHVNNMEDATLKIKQANFLGQLLSFFNDGTIEFMQDDIIIDTQEFSNANQGEMIVGQCQCNVVERWYSAGTIESKKSLVIRGETINQYGTTKVAHDLIILRAGLFTMDKKAYVTVGHNFIIGDEDLSLPQCSVDSISLDGSAVIKNKMHCNVNYARFKNYIKAPIIEVYSRSEIDTQPNSLFHMEQYHLLQALGTINFAGRSSGPIKKVKHSDAAVLFQPHQIDASEHDKKHGIVLVSVAGDVNLTGRIIANNQKVVILAQNIANIIHDVDAGYNTNAQVYIGADRVVCSKNSLVRAGSTNITAHEKVTLGGMMRTEDRASIQGDTIEQSGHIDGRNLLAMQAKKMITVQKNADQQVPNIALQSQNAMHYHGTADAQKMYMQSNALHVHEGAELRADRIGMHAQSMHLYGQLIALHCMTEYESIEHADDAILSDNAQFVQRSFGDIEQSGNATQVQLPPRNKFSYPVHDSKYRDTLFGIESKKPVPFSAAVPLVLRYNDTKEESQEPDTITGHLLCDNQEHGVVDHQEPLEKASGADSSVVGVQASNNPSQQNFAIASLVVSGLAVAYGCFDGTVYSYCKDTIARYFDAQQPTSLVVQDDALAAVENDQHAQDMSTVPTDDGAQQANYIDVYENDGWQDEL